MFGAIGREILEGRSFVGLGVPWKVKKGGFVGLDVRWSVETRGFVDPGAHNVLTPAAGDLRRLGQIHIIYNINKGGLYREVTIA